METLHRKDGVPDDAGSCSSRHVVPGATGFIGSGVLPSSPSFPHLPLSILQEHQECDPSETMIWSSIIMGKMFPLQSVCSKARLQLRFGRCLGGWVHSAVLHPNDSMHIHLQGPFFAWMWGGKGSSRLKSRQWSSTPARRANENMWGPSTYVNLSFLTICFDDVWGLSSNISTIPYNSNPISIATVIYW